MNVERAKQIYNAKETISVKLDGDPVWIEKVDADNGVATVQVGNNPVNTRTVSVFQLQEEES
ncbi:H-type small acid-soluble spore protein [Paenibacillus protaetiae]|uniref:H-type small acid-soluble spore protein n=1 Tax=Paenibacillus protaetiae TaxID=2509456 RepID=A0A4P6EZ58_9BACL|nr:H-type small acid-soluble spore protein [Paenibacillus protaetiae]QAY68156.1 H-type small acid-soluble spore protein [Paenibacillus protaetiae]